jgi:hypothetical protein
VEGAADPQGCEGHPETHYTRIYRIWRRWVDSGCMDAIFAGSVSRLHADGHLDTAVIHGDGTTTAAKKGGDNLGFSGHKRVKGDKVVALCDRPCNVIAPFVVAPGNRNEAPFLREALPEVIRIVREVGMDLCGPVVSLDGVYRHWTSYPLSSPWRGGLRSFAKPELRLRLPTSRGMKDDPAGCRT